MNDELDRQMLKDNHRIKRRRRGKTAPLDGRREIVGADKRCYELCGSDEVRLGFKVGLRCRNRWDRRLNDWLTARVLRGNAVGRLLGGAAALGLAATSRPTRRAILAATAAAASRCAGSAVDRPASSGPAECLPMSIRTNTGRMGQRS